MTERSLPEGFETLEPYASAWAVRGSDARKCRRIASTAAERQEFYDAVSPYLEAALNYLDRFPLESLDPRQTRLLDMMLTLAHISLAVELQGSNEAFHALSHAHFTITRSTGDASQPI